MKKPRLTDFYPNSPVAELASPLENMPAIEKPPKSSTAGTKQPSPTLAAETTKSNILEETEAIIQQTPRGITKVTEIRVTLPLPTELLSFLDQMERDIFVRRSAKFRSKQRLTKNSIARTWLALLRQMQININDVKDDADLLKRLSDAVDKYHIV